MSETVWTEKRLEYLALLKAQDLPIQEIADLIGVTKRTVENRFYWDRMTPEGRIKRRQNINARRRELHAKTDKRITVEQVQVAARPSEEQIKQRDVRNAMPYRDLTAFMLGDPPIGFSALDQRA